MPDFAVTAQLGIKLCLRPIQPAMASFKRARTHCEPWRLPCRDNIMQSINGKPAFFNNAVDLLFAIIGFVVNSLFPTSAGARNHSMSHYQEHTHTINKPKVLVNARETHGTPGLFDSKPPHTDVCRCPDLLFRKTESTSLQRSGTPGSP